jgi:hypothetical protein
MSTKFWTEKRDARLLRLKEAGRSASEIAALLGTTKGAVLGRLHRLQGIVFKSETSRARRLREFASKRRRAVRAARRAALKTMKQRMGWGMPRGEAMALASRDGLSFQAIGTALGISRQAAYKVVARWMAITGDFRVGVAAATVASVADLTFLPVSRRVLRRNVKSKATLESDAC